MLKNEIIKYLKDNKVGIVTNSFNPELLKMSKFFYNDIYTSLVVPGIVNGVGGPVRFYGFTCFNYILTEKWFTNQFDYIIYVDEDCFITNIESMINILKEFIEGNYGFAGIPDGGLCCHRNHNPVSINTFFTIFNVKEIKKVYDPEKVLNTKFDDSLKVFKPDFLIYDKSDEYKKELENKIPYCKIVRDNPKDVCSRHQIPWNILWDDFEPYYKIFFYLLKNGLKPMYLHGRDSLIDDLGITTELLYNNEPWAYHTWFARNFSDTPEQFQRILKVYNKCVTLRHELK